MRGALDKLKSALDGLNSPTLLSAIRASSTDDTRFIASAGATGAATGSYAVEVSAPGQGAESWHRAPLRSADTVVGTGTLTLSLAGKSASITIDDSNNTLAGIRDAINAARDADGQPLGVSATLVTSTGGVEPAGTYLVLSSAKTGAANTISLTQAGGDGGLAALQYETGGLRQRPDRKGAARPTRWSRSTASPTPSASNTVSGALSGVTLNLKATTTAPVTLTVAADTGGVQAQAAGPGGCLQRLIAVLKEQGGYNAAARRGGVLIGDPALARRGEQLRTPTGRDPCRAPAARRVAPATSACAWTRTAS